MTLRDDDLAELARLEESLWRTSTRFDHDHLEAVLAEQFLEFGRSGRRYGRDEVLATPSQEIVATLPLPDLRIQEVAEGVALVTYRSEVTSDVVEVANRASVWSKATGHWQLHFHQGTPVV